MFSPVDAYPLAGGLTKLIYHFLLSGSDTILESIHWHRRGLFYIFPRLEARPGPHGGSYDHDLLLVGGLRIPWVKLAVE